MWESVLPMFSSRSFIISGLTFRSLIHVFAVCLLSCESDWSVPIIFPKEATNGTGLLDKSMQTDCILSVDRIMGGLHEVPHSFSYWLWGGLCNGVLFPLDKEVPWLVTFLMKALQRKCKMCAMWCSQFDSCFC